MELSGIELEKFVVEQQEREQRMREFEIREQKREQEHEQWMKEFEESERKIKLEHKQWMKEMEGVKERTDAGDWRMKGRGKQN